jgi:hypothetical protein
MIYRILAESWPFAWDEPTQSFRELRFGPLRGGWVAALPGPWDMKSPRLKHPRTRFFFTERGWRELGKAIVAHSRREGRTVRVVRRKNPRPSQIVYQDELQVAILPNKAVKRKPRE